MDSLFIAVEYNEREFSNATDVNDNGSVCYTKEAAWDEVKDIFSAEHTVIHQLNTNKKWIPVEIGYTLKEELA